jgi:hypothetical protein
MNKDIHRIINKGLFLYRYDIIEPPKEGWTSEYKSPIYIWPDAGPKNEIGAFFFFEDKVETVEEGKIALSHKENMIKDFNPELSLWITYTLVQDKLYMLDLSKCKDVVDFCIALWNEGINVFRDDFYNFCNRRKSKPLSQIKKDVVYLVSHNDKVNTNKQIQCKCEIFNFYNNVDSDKFLAYACQGLTDFSNGKIFKKILEEKGFDGYIFKETETNTFCLFNSDKLSSPKVTTIHGIVNEDIHNN